MSALVVSRNHIVYLVEAGWRIPEPHHHLSWVWNIDRQAGSYSSAELWLGDQQTAARIGQMLWDENIKSVLFRYEDCTRETMPGPIGETFEYGDHPYVGPCAFDFSPVAVLKAIDCLKYQSCEHREWERSEAFAYCRSLAECAIGRLPGYDEARWEIT